MLILPAIDIMDGKCVRLAQGRFDRATTYGDPIEQCNAFMAQGAEWIHVVDLDGAREGKPVQHELLREMTCNTSARIQVGGGVRDLAHIEGLLAAGAGRVVVGSAAVLIPEEVHSWVARFGSERICCALDVSPVGERFEVRVKGWRQDSGLDLAGALSLFPHGKLRHVLVTDISRDGGLAGPNLALVQFLRTARPDLALQASGGVASLGDLAALRDAGASAAIVGRALYERAIRLEDALAL